MTEQKKIELTTIPTKKRFMTWPEFWRDVVIPYREDELRAALTRIEELTDAINNIIGHQVLVGGPMAEHSAIVRIARAVLLPSPPAEGDQG